jgi:hypothetical protein
MFHRIDTGAIRPIHQPTSRLILAKQVEVGEMLDNTQRYGVIEESDSSL